MFSYYKMTVPNYINKIQYITSIKIFVFISFLFSIAKFKIITVGQRLPQVTDEKQ